MYYCDRPLEPQSDSEIAHNSLGFYADPKGNAKYSQIHDANCSIERYTVLTEDHQRYDTKYAALTEDHQRYNSNNIIIQDMNDAVYAIPKDPNDYESIDYMKVSVS